MKTKNSYVDKKVMKAKYEPTFDKALEMLLYVLIVDNNDRTIVPNYFLGKEREMIEILSDYKLNIRIYFKDGEKWLEKIEAPTCTFCGSKDVVHKPAYKNGHWLCRDCEQSVYEEVRDFMEIRRKQ